MASRSLEDQPHEVRPGEDLDPARLEAALRLMAPDLVEEGQEFPALTVEQFPSGYSNLTYLIRAGDRELVLRRPPFGAKIKSGHDMGREYKILSRLAKVYPKVPKVLAYCEDPKVLGAPFYLMERVHGVILRSRLPDGFRPSRDTMRRLSEAFIDNLAELHAVDVKAAGLADLGHGEGYVERQVVGWTERYKAARTEYVPDLEIVYGWLADHMPAQSGTSLIHNDYKYDNVVLDPSDLARIIAVLDWEMATVGDPLMDLGSTLGYWIDPEDPPSLRMLPFVPTSLPGNLGRRELAERYAQKTGRSLEDLLFYYTYALFKIAVIAQQIYARYVKGLTQDERFAGLGVAVHILGRTAVTAIEKGRIDRLEE
jgi:aminoglycoside phosphotransferase (APT) family kinase protein